MLLLFRLNGDVFDALFVCVVFQGLRHSDGPERLALKEAKAELFEDGIKLCTDESAHSKVLWDTWKIVFQTHGDFHCGSKTFDKLLTYDKAED